MHDSLVNYAPLFHNDFVMHLAGGTDAMAASSPRRSLMHITRLRLQVGLINLFVMC